MCPSRRRGAARATCSLPCRAAANTARLPRVCASLGASESQGGVMPKSFSMLPVAGARRPRCPATTPAARRATRASATRPTRRPSRRSSPSCATPAAGLTAARLRALIVVLWRAGPAHPRSARARRGRPRPAPRLAARAPRQGRPPPRGRHGRLGLGATPALARPRASSCRSGRCSASHRTDPRARLVGRRRAHRAPPRRRARLACADASRRTSSATRTPSRWPAKASR